MDVPLLEDGSCLPQAEPERWLLAVCDDDDDVDNDEDNVLFAVVFRSGEEDGCWCGEDSW